MFFKSVCCCRYWSGFCCLIFVLVVVDVCLLVCLNVSFVVVVVEFSVGKINSIMLGDGLGLIVTP